jgi:hypothetical protein
MNQIPREKDAQQGAAPDGNSAEGAAATEIA